MVTEKANRFLHASNKGISMKDVGQSRKFMIRNPIHSESTNRFGRFTLEGDPNTPLVAQRLPPINENDIDREMKEESAWLDQLKRTDPKRFRAIQLKEGAFDDIYTIEEINEELRKLGVKNG